MSQHIYDYAIVGSGLTGLICATRLAQDTKNVVLLDGLDHLGGINRPISFPTGILNNGLRFVSDSPSGRQALLFLEDLLGLKLIGETLSHPPLTFEEGKLREFVGFGDHPPEFYEQIRPLTTGQEIQTTLEPYQWTQLLQEKYQGATMPRSFVTKFQIEEGKVHQLTINGAKTIRAANVIYTGHVKQLATLLGRDALAPRVHQKLSKNVYWTALCLDLCHAKPVTESAAIHILNGTTQDEIGPCAGRFLPVVETEKGLMQASQWVTFLEEEVTEDSEIVGTALKKIKRQIKRAYPEALEGLVRERIMVAPMIGGDGELKLSGDQTVPGIENLWVASAAMSPEHGLVGSIQQARLVLASLGFGKMETVSSEQEIIEETSL